MSVNKRPTIRDVASLAGVSKSLVSLVYLSPEAVSEVRKTRVLDAAKKLGFWPNFLARSLAADSGTFVGILVADLHNPLFVEIVDYVRAAIEAAGEYAFMTSAMVPDFLGHQIFDRRTVSALIDLRPKSVLVVGSIQEIRELNALPDSVPIIVASAIPEGIGRASSVRANDEKGMQLIIEHLVDNDHSRIAYISVESGLVAASRRAAYTKSMLAKNIGKYIQIEEIANDGEDLGYEAAKRLLASKNPPTAITGFNDLIAIGAQQAVSEFMEVGGKFVAVVGYDNTFLAGLKQISLTSVDPGNREIGIKAAELLISESKSHPKRGVTFLLEPKLVIRKSSVPIVKVQEK
jgi:DNA-binding LacI/PurR family transcriptional regulator